MNKPVSEEELQEILKQNDPDKTDYKLANHALASLPRLVSEIKRLREEIAAMRGALDNVCKHACYQTRDYGKHNWFKCPCCVEKEALAKVAESKG